MGPLETHSYTYTHTHTHTHTFCQSILQPKKMAVGYETGHLSQKKETCMVNSQLYQLKITIMYILNDIIIVNKIDNRLNL
jgi:hypothetical protein